MRIACPFTPFAVSIVARIERRQVTPRRWRFRLRSLLFLVATLALGMGGVVTWQRREQSREWGRVLSLRQADYKARAAGYARAEASYRKASTTGETVTVTHGCDRGWATVSLRGPESYGWPMRQEPSGSSTSRPPTALGSPSTPIRCTPRSRSSSMRRALCIRPEFRQKLPPRLGLPKPGSAVSPNSHFHRLRNYPIKRVILCPLSGLKSNDRLFYKSPQRPQAVVLF